MPYRINWGPAAGQCVVDVQDAGQAVDLIVGHKANYRSDLRIDASDGGIIDFAELLRRADAEASLADVPKLDRRS